MKTMIPPQVGMRLRTLRKEKKGKKKRKAKKKKKKKGQRKKRKKYNERKREKGQCYYLLFHTCASKQHHDLHDRESHMLSLSYASGEFFIIEFGLYIPMMGFLKVPQVFMSKQVGCTPTQFLLLSFHIFRALVHPLHGIPYSLTLISINGHL